MTLFICEEKTFAKTPICFNLAAVRTPELRLRCYFTSFGASCSLGLCRRKMRSRASFCFKLFFLPFCVIFLCLSSLSSAYPASCLPVSESFSLSIYLYVFRSFLSCENYLAFIHFQFGPLLPPLPSSKLPSQRYILWESPLTSPQPKSAHQLLRMYKAPREPSRMYKAPREPGRLKT